MVRQPSADPFKLILGSGTIDEREDYVEDIEIREKQLWYVENTAGEVIDIHQYKDGVWRSLLGEFVRSVSGIEPNSDGEVTQVKEVSGPSPDASGESGQIGYDAGEGEIYVYESGRWTLLASIETTVGETVTHDIDPSDYTSDVDTGFTASTSETADGSLDDEKTYKWAVTYVTPWGETSFTSTATETATTGVGGHQGDLSDLPVPSDDEVTGKRIYRTEGDGDTLYRVDTLEDEDQTTYTDTSSDADINGNPTAPTTNTTSAHSGTLPETSVSFADDGHNHDPDVDGEGSAIVVPEHDINPDEGPHIGGLPWDEIENVPSTFAPDDHDINPGQGPHTGGLPWTNLENVPDLASDPHGDDAHEPDYSKVGHDNTDHSENYITSAKERIRYGAGQLGDITQQTNLQPPVPIDVSGTAVKVYLMARSAPAGNVSSTIIIQDSAHGEYFNQTFTLPSGNTIEVDTGVSGTTIYDESQISFSLNDTDSGGQDFGVYLIVETEIGS